MLGLADIESGLGKFAEAEKLAKECLDITKRVLGEEHSTVPFILHSLCLIYQNQNRFDLAEPLAVQSYELGQRLLGPDHYDVLVWVSSLADIYNNLGKFDKAEPLARRAYEGFKTGGRRQGQEHAGRGEQPGPVLRRPGQI